MDAAKTLRAMLTPHVLPRAIIRKFAIGSLEFRMAMQAVDRAQYVFGIRQAISLASKLNYPRVSVLEFGVGTGEGLQQMESYASELGRAYGVGVDVYGFDLGTGLPAPPDFRDLPFVWKAGDYQMDVERVRSQLTTARLILGDVLETIPQFLESHPAPIGFISFDLDYYSSTTAAFQVFEGTDQTFLPRVMCYFDDVVSDGRQLHSEDLGELLAIKEFNERCERSHKLRRTYIREPLIKFSAAWLRQIWIYHRFGHPQYNDYIEG